MNLCSFGIHKWLYLRWPDDLSTAVISFVLGASYQGRWCPRCNRVQIPEHNCAYEYVGQWHWHTLETRDK